MNLKTLNKLKDQGYLNCQNHPNLPLLIWKYTNKTVYDGAWDEITLKCRGLVTDLEGNQVNDCAPKFFNWNEERGKYVCDFKNDFRVYEKLDGSLIQVFMWEGQLIVTSSGSFDSDHAYWAKEVLDRDYPDVSFDGGLTYIFELTGKRNRIVVNYDHDLKLTLLTVRDRDGDLPLRGFTEFERVKTVDLGIKKWKDLKSLPEIENEEGYVIRFENGNRVKIKFADYVEKHRLITNISNLDIWQYLREDKDVAELRDEIPDEILDWFEDNLLSIQFDYECHEIAAIHEWATGIKTGRLPETETFDASDRPKFAKYITSCKYRSELFAMLDGKEYSDMLWKRCRPEHEKAF